VTNNSAPSYIHAGRESDEDEEAEAAREQASKDAAGGLGQRFGVKRGGSSSDEDAGGGRGGYRRGTGGM
jgi:hypothetical protein